MGSVRVGGGVLVDPRACYVKCRHHGLIEYAAWDRPGAQHFFNRLPSSFSGVTSIGSIVERCCVKHSSLLSVFVCRVCPPIWISYSRAA